MISQLRVSFRSLCKHATHSFTVILALALGIGVSVAIFGLVEAMVMRPFSFPELDRVVGVYEKVPLAGSERYPTSPATFLDWVQTSTSFQSLAAYRYWGAALSTASGAEALAAYKVSPGFFSLTAVEPLMGRTFGPETQTDDSTLVLSYRFWKNRLGGNPNIIGQTLTIDKSAYVVIAVMPDSFDFPIAAEAWAPLRFTTEEKASRTDRTLGVLGRLRPAVSVDRAQEEMSVIASRLAELYPAEDRSRSTEVVLLRHAVNRYANKFLLVLMIAVSVLLLLACANVTNLQLARGAMRRKELAVKIALGADRRHIVAEVAIENLLFSSLAAIIGIPIAYAALRLVKASVTGAVIRNAAGLLNARISFPVLGFAIALAVFSALLVTLPNVFQSSDVNLTEALSAEGRSSSGSVRRGLRSALVGSQIVLATFLLIAAGMLINSFMNLTLVPLGYDPHNVGIYHATLSPRDYRDSSRVEQFFNEAMRRIREISGITSASVVSILPSLDESNTANVYREGEVDASRPSPVELRIVGPDYFRSLAIRVSSGREFLDSDKDGSQPVAVVSDALARRLWPGRDPLGRRVVVGTGGKSAVVVGVVADVNHFLLEHEFRPAIYLPMAQQPERSMYIVFRTHGPLQTAIAQAREAIGSIDHNDRVYKLDSFDGILSDVSGGVRVVAALLCVVGLIGLMLAFAGVYAVLSYLIAVQSRDIAIRMSLGATSQDVVNMFLLYLTKIAGPAAALGVLIGVTFGHVVSRMISAVELSPLLLPAAIIVVFGGSALAMWLPVRRIASISPATVVR